MIYDFIYDIWFMQAMTSLRKPQPHMLHQANWNETRPDAASQLTGKHLAERGEAHQPPQPQHKRKKKHSTLHWVPANLSGNSQGFNTSMGKCRKGQKGERRRGKAWAPVSWWDSWEVCLRGGGGPGGRHRGKHHSLDAALGRHRPLPSADWWEPTQSASKICYCWWF